jgi:hypothetical protein
MVAGELRKDVSVLSERHCGILLATETTGPILSGDKISHFFARASYSFFKGI